MGFVRGVKELDDKYRVQIKVNGTVINRTFLISEYGSKEKTKDAATRFVETRKSLSEKLPSTNVKNVYEKVVTVGNANYLYLRAIKGDLDKAICVGVMNTTRERMRRTQKYANVLSKLSGLLVKRD